jgi:hypothetical protein
MLKLALTLSAILLTGCAGLNVSWSATASYNTDAKTVTQSIHLTSPVDPLGDPRKK